MPKPSWSRLLSALIAVLGLGFSPAAGRAITPDQAPADWVAYAEGATQTITGWLNAKTPAAVSVRAKLQAARPDPNQAAQPLVVKIWPGHDGVITRVEFASLGDAQTDHELWALLAGGRLPPPPKRMRLPMRIALQPTPDRGSSDTALNQAQTRSSGV